MERTQVKFSVTLTFYQTILGVEKVKLIKKHYSFRVTEKTQNNTSVTKGDYLIPHLGLLPDYTMYRKWRKPVILQRCRYNHHWDCFMPGCRHQKLKSLNLYKESTDWYFVNRFSDLNPFHLWEGGMLVPLLKIIFFISY